MISDRMQRGGYFWQSAPNGLGPHRNPPGRDMNRAAPESMNQLPSGPRQGIESSAWAGRTQDKCPLPGRKNVILRQLFEGMPPSATSGMSRCGIQPLLSERGQRKGSQNDPLLGTPFAVRQRACKTAIKSIPSPTKNPGGSSVSWESLSKDSMRCRASCLP